MDRNSVRIESLCRNQFLPCGFLLLWRDKARRTSSTHARSIPNDIRYHCQSAGQSRPGIRSVWYTLAPNDILEGTSMDKSEARAIVWSELIKIAKPDSRFHLNFNEYIPDFEGGEEATARLTSLDIYRRSSVVFFTPDNCLERLRARTVRDGKVQIMPTYGIRRGLVRLRPEDVPQGLEPYAVLLDAIETLGHHISLAALRQQHRVDLVVTGASAVSRSGVRFGKGHGFFDLEWAMLYQTGVVETSTPVVAFVHDCQVVDIELEASPFDTICDYVVTPTRLIEVAHPQKPTAGVLWNRLEEGMMEDIPPLRELRTLEAEGKTR